MVRPSPLDLVRAALAPEWDVAQLDALPRGYQRVGDVVIVDLPLPEPADEAAAAYARVLGARTVLGRDPGIHGELRRPRMRHLWGDVDATTTHTEHGVRFRLNPSRVMWSAGNLMERRRVGAWDLAGQTVVDLFAGVGYFTLPALVRAGAARVVACEKNPVSHGFLLEGARLGGVAERLDARQGDCRDVAPAGVADRVLLGLLPDALPFLDVAVRALKPRGGFLHVHRVVGVRDADPFAPVAAAAETAGWAARLERVVDVKPYGPGHRHVVLDVEARP